MRFPIQMTLVTSAALLTTLVPGIAAAQRTGLGDLVGARAGQAEDELMRRGYRNVGGEKGDDRSYAYWWNEGRNQCVTIATTNGRYDSITPTTPADCQHRRGRDEGRDFQRERGDRRDERSRGFVAPTELSQVCRDEAANAFDRRRSEVTANAPIRQPNGYIVQGWYDRRSGKGTQFFNCRFDQDGEFLGVN